MKTGRKPKPTRLRLVTGNAGHRPLNKNEPTPRRSLPTPPPELSDEAKIEWKRVSEELHDVGLLTEIDRAVLGCYCQAYGRWIQAESAVSVLAGNDPKTNALIIKTKSGNFIQNPLVGIANKAMADVLRYATEFGMTPSARSRIVAGDPGKNADPADRYFSG